MIQQPKLPEWKCHIFSITRHQIRLPRLNNTLHLEHYKTSSPPPPLNTMLHLQGHKTVALAPPLSIIFTITRHQLPHPLRTIRCTLRHQPRHLCCIFEDQPGDPLWTLRRPLRIARHQPRHPLWALCCILSIITRHQPRAPSEQYVAPWASQDINPAIPSEDYVASSASG